MKNETVSSAYLFFGPASLGKFTIARYFAKTLLKSNNLTQDLNRHPDWMIIENNNEQISINTIRKIKKEISFLPSVSKRKIILFEEASYLSIEAQNALLKTLEEPPKYAVIILVSQSNNLLPTILSRCAQINFQPVPKTEIKKELIERGVEPKRAGFLAHISNGQIGLVLDNEVFEKRWLDNLDGILAFKPFSFKEKIEYFKNLDVLDFSFWLSIYKDVLYYKVNTKLLANYPPQNLSKIEKIALDFDIKQVYLIMRKLQETKKLLATNVNQKLLLENLALSL